MRNLCLFAAGWVGFLLLPEVVAAATKSEVEPGRQLDLRQGMAVYRSSCAECHDSGKSGAPRLSNAKDWSQHSFQWFSVLRDHANRGFLKMPAKGGHPELSNEDVSAAVFYMMEKLKQ